MILDERVISCEPSLIEWQHTSKVVIAVSSFLIFTTVFTSGTVQPERGKGETGAHYGRRRGRKKFAGGGNEVMCLGPGLADLTTQKTLFRASASPDKRFLCVTEGYAMYFPSMKFVTSPSIHCDINNSLSSYYICGKCLIDLL